MARRAVGIVALFLASLGHASRISAKGSFAQHAPGAATAISSLVELEQAASRAQVIPSRPWFAAVPLPRRPGASLHAAGLVSGRRPDVRLPFASAERPAALARAVGMHPQRGSGVAASAASTIREPVVSGGRLPLNVGFGTCLIAPRDTQRCVTLAIDAGYRVFDTAQRYGNEYGLGQALQVAFSSGKLRREEVFVTTKVWVDNMGYDETLRSIEESAANLGNLEGGIDLVLVHWPGNFVQYGDPMEALKGIAGKSNEKLRRGTWEALEKLQQDGVVKQLGVANFGKRHLTELLSYAKVKPIVDQFEIHPYNQRDDLVKLCQAQGITVEAYSPLGGKGNEDQVTDLLLMDPVLQKIAASHGKTVPQIILRWHLQRGITPIPKSVNQPRIEENIDVFEFELSQEDMAAIAELDRNRFAVYDADKLA